MLHDMIGNPTSFPANVWFAYKHDTPISQYDYISGVPPSAEMYVAGVDLKPFLGKGWMMSTRLASQNDGGFLATQNECTLLLQLHWGESYRIKLSLVPPSKFKTSQPVSFELNGKALGVTALKPNTRAEITLTAPADLVRQGLNTLTLRFGEDPSDAPSRRARPIRW